MTSTFFRQTFAATCLALIGATASAGVLYSQAPLGGLNGIQSDDSTGVYPQSFTVAPGSVLESIEWYGFHGPNSLGRVFDLFTVQIGGADVPSSSITSEPLDPSQDDGLFKYTLIVTPNFNLSSGTLDLANGLGTEWFWQYSNVDTEATAFTLNGIAGTVPEPQTAMLVLLGLAAAVGARRSSLHA